ncbi:uncharacterized protein DS421_11g331560 [Arachis hypogaea]|nr:uncharacterized protein DS421_11g331560 [Arachis hypogaea]
MLLSVPPIAAVTSSYSAPPPLVPPIITVAHHHSHSLLPLLTVVPPLFTMSISRQALDSKVPTPASASPAAGTAPVGPATPIHSNRIDPSWKYIITIEEENTNETNRGRQSATPGSTEEQNVNARKLDLESLGFKFLEEDAQGIDELHNRTPMAVARGGASSARRGASSMRGPMDFFVRRPEIAIARNKKEKLR